MLIQELTLCAWLKCENFDTPILNKLAYWAPGNYDFRTERSGALSLSYESGPGQPWAHYESSVRLAPGRWYYVAVALKAGGEVCFYIDGKPAGSAPQAGKFGLINREPLRIGAKPDPYSSFHGVIDEVRIYRRLFDCHHGGVVLVDGYLYGSNFKGHYAGNWVCLDWQTGKVMYEQKGLCKGSIT